MALDAYIPARTPSYGKDTMSNANKSEIPTREPRYARPKQASAHYKIATSTLWHWVKTRDGFPQPIKAGPNVTLIDLNAVDDYLRGAAE